MHWINIGLIFVAGLDIAMSLVIWLRNPKHRINITYGLVFFFLGIWSFFVFLFRSSFLSEDIVILDWIFRTKIFVGLLIALFLYIFSIYFPIQYKRAPWYRLVILVIPAVLLTLLIFLPFGFVGEPKYFPEGNLYFANVYFWTLFTIVFSYYLIGTAVRLIWKYKKSDGFHMMQIRYVLSTVIIAGGAGLVFNIFLPFFDHFKYEWIGPFYSFPMLFILSYFIFIKAK